jgi:hypothetical protein
MEEALVAMLLADAGVQALMATRVTWMKRTQGAPLPGGVLNRIAGQGVGDHMRGQDGLAYALVQVDAYGATYADSKRASRALRAALIARADPRFTGIFIRAERDFLEPAANGQPEIHRTSLDAEVWFLEG